MQGGMAQNLLSSVVRGALAVLREAAAEIFPSRSKGIHCVGREAWPRGFLWGSPAADALPASSGLFQDKHRQMESAPPSSVFAVIPSPSRPPRFPSRV